MWGDPHISVGRRVERPIQCRKVAETSQPGGPRRKNSAAISHRPAIQTPRLCLSSHDGYLSTCIAGSVREETVVVALRAEGADGDFLHPGLGGVLSDE